VLLCNEMFAEFESPKFKNNFQVLFSFRLKGGNDGKNDNKK